MTATLPSVRVPCDHCAGSGNAGVCDPTGDDACRRCAGTGSVDEPLEPLIARAAARLARLGGLAELAADLERTARRLPQLAASAAEEGYPDLAHYTLGEYSAYATLARVLRRLLAAAPAPAPAPEAEPAAGDAFAGYRTG